MRTLLCLCLLCCVATARAVIDLTPVPHETTCEGFTFKELLFKDGPRQILYQLPNKWTYRAGAGEVHLAPPDIPNADAVIQAAPLPASERLDEKAIAAARTELLSRLPSGSQMITVVSEEPNAVPLNGNPTYQIVVSYQVMGQTFLRGCLFSNIGDTQLRFRLTARKSDYEKLYPAFRSSILSWHWVEPSSTATVVQK
jgi:hypothetical protein